MKQISSFQTGQLVELATEVSPCGHRKGTNTQTLGTIGRYPIGRLLVVDNKNTFFDLKVPRTLEPIKLN